jgi:hypothetical protein
MLNVSAALETLTGGVSEASLQNDGLKRCLMKHTIMSDTAVSCPTEQVMISIINIFINY